jgi:beta-RFAP synthase
MASSGTEGVTNSELARWLGRGCRSALGIHGFGHGGFLVDGGKRTHDEIAPLCVHLPVPESWQFVLVVPSSAKGLHGVREQHAFDQLITQGVAEAMTDRLCRLVLLGMLPAIGERRIDAFGEAMWEFNRRVGEAFASIQGGAYASTESEELVTFIREQQIQGAGQSSWGPTVFAIVDDAERAGWLARQLSSRWQLKDHNVHITQAANHGAQLTRLDGASERPRAVPPGNQGAL